VRRDDVGRDREAQARALARRLGRVERLEHVVALLRRDAGAVILHHDLDRVADRAASQRDRAAALIRDQRLLRIGDQVREHLEQLVVVAEHPRAAARRHRRQRGDHQAHVLHLEVVAEQQHGAPQHVHHAHRLECGGLAAHEAQQVADDVAGPPRLAEDQLEVLAQLLDVGAAQAALARPAARLVQRPARQRPERQQRLRGGDDRRKGILEIVGDAARDPADDVELLALRLGGRHVPRVAHRRLRCVGERMPRVSGHV